MITWTEYNRRVAEAVSTQRDWSVGQAFVSVLRDTRPDLVGVVRDTGVDPLYSGGSIARFLTVIRDHW